MLWRYANVAVGKNCFVSLRRKCKCDMPYLNPKIDLTFKKVFGEHEDVMMSFLNALLPLEDDEQITSLVYMNTELVPENYYLRNSIVDVRCTDKLGRLFIVEMQMHWTREFENRVLFNASKAYVKQVKKGDKKLRDLKPVYSLNIVNDKFSKGDNYYHDYRIVEDADTKHVIKGLRFIFIELPKFSPKTFNEKRMQVLWLRFLTEISNNTDTVSEDLTSVPIINKAVEELERSAFTDAELEAYDRRLDAVMTEQMFADGYFLDGKEAGLVEGMAKGREEGYSEANANNARAMKAKGIAAELIAEITGLSPEAIAAL